MFAATGGEYSVEGEYITNKVLIKMKHNICRQYFNVTPNNFISKGSRCPICSGQKIISGFNDVKTVRPDVYEMLYDKSLGLKYSHKSSVKVDWVCPRCNNIIKNRSFYQTSSRGLCCPYCSDGISYPNKFMHEFFNQVSNQIKNYIIEYSPEWIGRKRYDNYFECNGKKYIVEVDGGLGMVKEFIQNQSYL